ncbi:sugar transferase [uncultured Oscillibacter sp.]|uniref:sugar transferase n=1 Tax=uncultured Oscillibacter sp. TaxID=876091 RepID=UPI0034474284
MFKLYKFLLVKETRGKNCELRLNTMRPTKFERALQSTSLDEILELWNILKGDMFIVGPCFF